ncbi:unnamed protein product, partial [Pylaiella littoralis]
ARAPPALKTTTLPPSSSPFTMPDAAPAPSSTTYSPSPAAGAALTTRAPPDGAKTVHAKPSATSSSLAPSVPPVVRASTSSATTSSPAAATSTPAATGAPPPASAPPQYKYASGDNAFLHCTVGFLQARCRDSSTPFAGLQQLLDLANRHRLPPSTSTIGDLLAYDHFKRCNTAGQALLL